MVKIVKSISAWLSSPYWLFFPRKEQKPVFVAPKWIPPKRQKPIKYYKKDDWRKGIKKNISIVGPR